MIFFTVGINYHNAPIQFREKFAFNPSSAAEILDKLKRRSLIDEALYLGTCNRAEVYAVTSKCGPVDIQNELCSRAGLDPALTKDFWYTKAGCEAIRHLFRVASSLDAMVVGEAQILGQIKDAYFAARKFKTTGPFINRAMLNAIMVAKKIRSETQIGRGQVSIASVAADLVKSYLNDISDKTILVVGAGEMGALVVRALKRDGEILVANRTYEKAQIIAEHAGGRAIKWENLKDALLLSDIVISSTGSPTPVIDKQMLNYAAGLGKKSLIIMDLGTPRDVEPVEKQGFHIFNIDDLKKIATDNSNKRMEEARRAETIVLAESEKFFRAISNREHLNAIAALNRKFAAIQENELMKAFSKLDGLSDNERDIIRACTDSIISKIASDPIKLLKDLKCGGIEGQIFSDALYHLFNLEKK